MASVPDDDDLKPDSVFAGRYRIRRMLGEGDRKRTYLADDTVFPRRVALSLIKASAARTDPEGTRREAEALARAGTNENVVTLHDAGSFEGTDYLVFDYLSGGTLREYLAKRLERSRPLSVEEVMKLGRRLARALAHVHGLGLIHRDIAPANVWLDERQMAHLGDFDSAASLDAARDPVALPPTTEAYAPPEQLAGGPLDQRSDLYSLGAVLYEALTGAPPERLSRALVAKQLTAARPGLPLSLQDTVCSLLAESPDERPASAEQVLDALEPSQVYRTNAEGTEAWADTLPFPLASILWQYSGEPDEGLKVDYLLKFFEALAQFTATVLLSACLTDRELFDANRAAWFRADRKRLELERASFGAWVELAGRLASVLNTLREDDGEAERLRHLFRTRDLALADALTSADLFSILRHAWDRRNNWAGHGGIPGLNVQRERLRDLSDLLIRTRTVLGWSFETWILVKPGPMTLSGNIFDLTATVLKGPNSAFRRQQLKLTEPLDTTRLYLVNDGEFRALELAPLIRLLTGTTGHDACYFYNRMEGTEARWVSYHYHQEPEVLLPDDGLAELVATVSGPNAAPHVRTK